MPMDPSRRRPKSSAAALAGAALGAGMLAAAAMAAAAGGRDGRLAAAPPPAVTSASAASARKSGGSEAARVRQASPVGEAPARPRAAGGSPGQMQSRDEAPVLKLAAELRAVEGPALAVIIDDIGFDAAAIERLLALDIPLTFSVLPYAPDAPGVARRIAAAGRDVFVHLPMEPAGLEDPGPFAITTAMPAEAAARRAAWALDRLPGASGVNNHMGSRLTADASAVSRALAAFAGSDLVFVDSVTTPDSVAASAAARLGLAAARRDVFLDHVRDPRAISAQIEAALAKARTEGSAIAIAHPYPETIAALADLQARADAAGVTLVAASALVRRSHQADRSAPALTAQASARID